MCGPSIWIRVAGIAGLGLTALSAHGADTVPAENDELAEVTVTAQRRSERLQDVPVTVSALSGDQLQTEGIQNILDLKQAVPGLSVGNQVGFAFTHLRGVGSSAIGPGIENPIALYIDGVYYASTSSSFLNFIDVQNVEVLKGPQGTLFGRNSSGGLIQVTTREPTQQTIFDVDVGYGNYQSGISNMYVAGGITSTLAADFAAQVSGAGEGYGRNLATAQEVYRNDLSVAARSKWVWTPGDLTKITGTFDYSNQRNSSDGTRVVPGASNPAFLGAPPPTGGPWDINSNQEPLFFDENGGASIRVDQQLEFFNIMDIAAYRRSDAAQNFDLDITPVPFEAANIHTDEKQVSEELQLSSKPQDRIHWAAGLYYFYSDARYDPSHILFNPDPALSAIAPFTSLAVFGTQLASSYSGYGQATFPILPDTDLTLGARYTDETHSLSGTMPLYLPNGASIIADTLTNAAATFKKPTYRAALDHHFSPDEMIYASYSTGFKSGGFNTQSLTDPVFQPETLDASEIGLKSELFDRRFLLNIAAFYYKYKNIQEQKVEGASTGIINGAAATIKGIDLDFTVNVFKGFSIGGSAEYLDSVFNSFPDAPKGNPVLADATPLTIGSVAGNRLPYAPEGVVTLSGNYDFTTAAGGFKFNVTAYHSASFYLEPDNVINQPAYTKVNARVRWDLPESRWAITLWGQNLSNQATLEYASTLPPGIRSGTFDAPRTYGFTVAYHME